MKEAGQGIQRRDFDPDNEAASVPSPCVNVCRMNPQSGLCDGCLRTIDEIAGWGSASDQQKRHVWREIRRRQAALTVNRH